MSFIDNLELFKDSKQVKIYDYRRSLYSKVMFDKYHKATDKGHVVFIKQYRKDFYKPANFGKSDPFFDFNHMLRVLKIEHLINKAEDYVNILTELRDLFKEGYVLCHWEMKTIKSLQYVGNKELEFLKSGIYFPGHIRSIRHRTPQYNGHKALETNDGRVFYYRTQWHKEYKPDIDFTSQQPIRFEEDELITQEKINVVTNPNEEPLIIEE